MNKPTRKALDQFAESGMNNIEIGAWLGYSAKQISSMFIEYGLKNAKDRRGQKALDAIGAGASLADISVLTGIEKKTLSCVLDRMWKKGMVASINTDDGGAWIKIEQGSDASDKVLGYLSATNLPSTVEQISESLGITSKQASSALQTLKGRGIVSSIGRCTSSTWRKVLTINAPASSAPANIDVCQFGSIPQIGLLIEHQSQARAI